MESLLDVLDEQVNSCTKHHLFLIMGQGYLSQPLRRAHEVRFLAGSEM